MGGHRYYPVAKNLDSCSSIDANSSDHVQCCRIPFASSSSHLKRHPISFRSFVSYHFEPYTNHCSHNSFLAKSNWKVPVVEHRFNFLRVVQMLAELCELHSCKISLEHYLDSIGSTGEIFHGISSLDVKDVILYDSALS